MTIDTFEKYFDIKVPSEWENGRMMIEVLINTHQSLEKAYTSTSESVLSSEPSIGGIFQVTERALEQAFGALVAYSCKCAPTAELAARTCMEKSINVMYILNGDRTSKFLAWIRSYLELSIRQIDDWKKAAIEEYGELTEFHETAIRRRLEAITTLQSIHQESENGLREIGIDFNPIERWPSKISKRFSDVGESTMYATGYARMSSQVHGDAEDTLNYMLLSVSDDEDLKMNMALETLAFTEYCIFLGVLYYLKSVKDFQQVFYSVYDNKLDDYETKLVSEMEKIAQEWEW
ncbi:DUF5677 domain-containing protein [Sulfuricurvum sp.]|uniref:DUF5677 domain-containing protein n=1 Tax=Sulfuricurvum sp. TaxID=2025608 RepID=UPI00262B0824|nr:DUF5677 domain-containing protein [Sulfuricurvum sp.]MDD3595591.1 DUF5677 domain-containing protein [Sulfuricurvum sp.]